MGTAAPGDSNGSAFVGMPGWSRVYVIPTVSGFENDNARVCLLSLEVPSASEGELQDAPWLCGQLFKLLLDGPKRLRCWASCI